MAALARGSAAADVVTGVGVLTYVVQSPLGTRHEAPPEKSCECSVPLPVAADSNANDLHRGSVSQSAATVAAQSSVSQSGTLRYAPQFRPADGVGPLQCAP